MTTIVNDVLDVGVYNIVADQGTTLTRQIVYRNSVGVALNLGVNASAQMMVRKSYQVTSRVPAYRDSPVLWLGTAGVVARTQTLFVNSYEGVIVINVPASDMANVAAGVYDYDLDVTLGTLPDAGSAGDVVKIICGRFEVRQEMTY